MGILLSCPNFSTDTLSEDSLDNLQYSITKQQKDLEKLKFQTLEQNEQLEVVRAQNKGHLEAIQVLQLQIQGLCTQLDEQESLFDSIKQETQQQQQDITAIKKNQQERIKHIENAVLVEKETEESSSPTIELKLVPLDKEISTATFIWRVENFEHLQKKARSGKHQVINSDHFYSDRYGYKMKVRMYPNGRTEVAGTHLSLYIVIESGEYDAMLPWPFVRKVTLLLLDQEENPAERKNVQGSFEKIDAISCFGRPNLLDNEAYGFQKMIKLKDLEEKKFVVDGVMFIRVDVAAE